MRTAPKQESIDTLTSLRGIAALWVFMAHIFFNYPFFLFTRKIGTDSLKTIIQNGFFGVDLFFILSGFVICYVYYDHIFEKGSACKNIAKFYLLRLARIYPVHLFMLLVMLLYNYQRIFNYNEHFFQSALLNLSLTNSWSQRSNVLTWNIISWSLSVEWFLYLSFPLILFFLKRIDKIWKIILAMILLYIGYYLIILISNPNGMGIYILLDIYPNPRLKPPIILYGNLLRGVFCFLIGCLLFRIYMSKILHTLRWNAIFYCLLVILISLIVYNSTFNMVHIIFFYALLTCLIYSMIFLRGITRKILCSGVFMYLGKISFSFYMIHPFYISFLGNSLTTHFHKISKFSSEALYAAYLIVIYIGAVAISALLYHLIEQPCRNLLRNKIYKHLP